jgi:hypothetical protein
MSDSCLLHDYVSCLSTCRFGRLRCFKCVSTGVDDFLTTMLCRSCCSTCV